MTFSKNVSKRQGKRGGRKEGSLKGKNLQMDSNQLIHSLPLLFWPLK